MTDLSDDDGFWLLLIPFSLVMALIAMAHALAVKWLLAPFPTLADYASRTIVIAWILLAAWYADRIIRGIIRWERNRSNL